MADNHIVRTPTTDRQLIKVPTRLDELKASPRLYYKQVLDGLNASFVAFSLDPVLNGTVITNSVPNSFDPVGATPGYWSPGRPGLYLLSLEAALHATTPGSGADTFSLFINTGGVTDGGRVDLSGSFDSSLTSDYSVCGSCIVALDSPNATVRAFIGANIFLTGSVWEVTMKVGAVCIASLT